MTFLDDIFASFKVSQIWRTESNRSFGPVGIFVILKSLSLVSMILFLFQVRENCFHFAAGKGDISFTIILFWLARSILFLTASCEDKKAFVKALQNYS